MIKENIVIGDINTTFHDFTFYQNGMNITISSGSYTSNGLSLAGLLDEGTVNIPVNMYQDVDYEIWLTTNGIEVLQGKFLDIWTNNPIAEGDRIDRLCWFTVPKATKILDDVEINVIRMVIPIANQDTSELE
jgi:hypothetical protein